MVKANVMEEVEKEFQAQVSDRRCHRSHIPPMLILSCRQLEEFTFRHTDEEEVKKGKATA